MRRAVPPAAIVCAAFLVVLGSAAFVHSLHAYQRARLRAWLPAWIPSDSDESRNPRPSRGAENPIASACGHQC